MPYFLVIILLCLLSLYEFLDIKPDGFIVKENSRFWYYFVCAVSLWLIAAFRFETGRDWQNYIRYFNICEISETKSGFEPGFVLLNKFFSYCGSDFYFFQLCISSFCEFVIFKSIFKNSDFPAFTLLLYVFMFYFQMDMAQIRQHIAMALILCGSNIIKNRRLVLWIGIVVLAMMFHISAIIAFPLYFTYKMKISRKVAWLLFFAYIFLYLFGLNFVLGVLNLVIKLPFIPSRIVVIGSKYLASTIYGQQGQFSSGLGFLLNSFFNAFIVFMFCINKRKENNSYFVNYLIALYFLAFGRNFDQFSRLSNYYFICGNGLCAYNLLVGNKKFFKKCDFLRYCVCFVFLAFQIYTFSTNWFSVSKLTKTSYNLDYTPYKSFIFN